MLSNIFWTSSAEKQVPSQGTTFGSSSSEKLNEHINNIKELQFDLDKSLEINGNLQLQITDYDKSILNYKEQIKLNEEQIKIKEDMIKTIKPKWYHNRYLWFFGGVFLTSGTVYLAGQLD